MLLLRHTLATVSLRSGITCVVVTSAGWVFPGWVSWSRWFKSNYGVYPDQKYPGTLVKLARKPKSVRDMIILPELMKMEGLR